MSYQEVIKLPLVTFWMMQKNIDRMNAEKDYRMLMVAAHSQSGEDVGVYMERLKDEIGEIVIYDEAKRSMAETIDLDGLHELKNMNKAYG